jgi:hypothetical protein
MIRSACLGHSDIDAGDGAMTRSFSVHALSTDEVPIVFPLVNGAYPALDLKQWNDAALAFAQAENSGLLGLRGEGGYFCGLLIYRCDRNPWHEPRMAVDLFVALDLIEGATAVGALLAAAEAKANALACLTVQIRVDDRHAALPELVRKAGYAPAAELLTKAMVSGEILLN